MFVLMALLHKARSLFTHQQNSQYGWEVTVRSDFSPGDDFSFLRKSAVTVLLAAKYDLTCIWDAL